MVHWLVPTLAIILAVAWHTWTHGWDKRLPLYMALGALAAFLWMLVAD
jgi:hypothetical protein